MSWACIIKKLEVLEQISGHKVQLKSKSHKKGTSVSGDPTYAPAIIAPATIAPLKATIAPR